MLTKLGKWLCSFGIHWYESEVTKGILGTIEKKECVRCKKRVYHRSN